MDEEKPHTIGNLAIRMVGTIVGLLLLYVLSIGPALYFLELHPSGRTKDFADDFYTPLVVVLSLCPPLVPPLEAYGEFWQKLARPHHKLHTHP